MRAVNSVVASLWLFGAGFFRANRLDRILSVYSQDWKILKTTLNCMFLNGAVVLGSLILLDWTVKPSIARLLSTVLPTNTIDAALRMVDRFLFVSWVLPSYIISYFVSCMRYRQIAELVAFVSQRQAQQQLVDAPAPMRLLQVRKTDGITTIAGQSYSIFFYIIHFCISVLVYKLPVPYIGRFLGSLMLSTLYALTCFDYKWSLHGVALEHKTQFVEKHWAYYTGFGALMVIVATKLPFFYGSAVGLLMFPLFIVTAADADPRKAYLTVQKWYGEEIKLPRLPLFTPTVVFTNFVLVLCNAGSSAKKRPTTRHATKLKKNDYFCI